MKKVYTAPRIEFECFASSTNIAGDCDRIVGNPSKGSCGITSNTGTILFAGEGSGCDFNWVSIKGDNYDGFCYHAPSEDLKLFNS